MPKPNPIPATLTIRREPLDSPAAIALITALNAELSHRYPEEGANHFRLHADEVTEGRGAFLIALEGDDPIASGALRKLDATSAELKRMYVVPEARGRGISRAMLAALEAEARRLGVTLLLLETGERQHEALGLYESAGYTRIPRYGEYATSPLSLCLGKDL